MQFDVIAQNHPCALYHLFASVLCIPHVLPSARAGVEICELMTVRVGGGGGGGGGGSSRFAELPT